MSFTRLSYGYGRRCATASAAAVKAVTSSSRRALKVSCDRVPACQSRAPLARSATRWAMPGPPKATWASLDHFWLTSRSALACELRVLLVVVDVDALSLLPLCSHATKAMSPAARPTATTTATVE